MRVIISAGGTGGHIFPAVAVADELKRLDPDVQILFVGAHGKMEMERVPKAGYAIVGLWIAGLQRQLTLRNLWLNLQLPFKIAHSLWTVRRILRRFQPDVAVGFGGFASAPTLRAAASMGIPTVLQEQNSYAGVTNKILAQKAVKICVAYQGLEQFFPAEKLVLTGNPVRRDVWQAQDRMHAAAHFGLDPNKKTVAILGGSLGARTLNRAMEHNLERIAQNADIQWLWQCGKLYESTYQGSAIAQLPNVQMHAFFDQMASVYALADVVVARSGALTISELALTGNPSILVPSPNVAEDHQTKNAMALVNQHAAILVKDRDANDAMITSVFALLKDANQRDTLRKNLLSLGKPNAAVEIAQVVLSVAKG